MGFPSKFPWRFAALLLLAAAFLTALKLIAGYTVESPHELKWGAYGFSELLVDYDGGFVRRGLLGAVIHRFSAGASSLPFIDRLLFFNFAVLAALLLLAAGLSRWREPLAALLVFAMPGGVFAMALAGEMFFRKEVFFATGLCALALLTLLGRKSQSPALRISLCSLAVALAFALGILLPIVHEGFLFLSSPASLLVLFAAARGLRSAPESADPTTPIERALLLSYAGLQALLFAAMSFFKGNGEVARAIWSGLCLPDRLLVSPSGNISGAIDYIGFGLLQGMAMPKALVLSGMSWYWLTPFVLGGLYCLSLTVLFPAPTELSKPSPLAAWVCCYLGLALCAAPMFALGWDWGRWLAALNLSFTAVWLVLSPDDLRALAQLPSLRRRLDSPRALAFSTGLRKLCDPFESWATAHRRALVGVLCVLALTFRIPEACIGSCNGGWAVGSFGTAIKAAISSLRHR